jgi:hypothetical protein
MDGYFSMGKSSSGDVSNCPASGTTTGLNATGVTLVVSGTESVTCNGVAASAFCLGAGYNTVDLTAPTSGATRGPRRHRPAIVELIGSQVTLSGGSAETSTWSGLGGGTVALVK